MVLNVALAVDVSTSLCYPVNLIASPVMVIFAVSRSLADTVFLAVVVWVRLAIAGLTSSTAPASTSLAGSVALVSDIFDSCGCFCRGLLCVQRCLLFPHFEESPLHDTVWRHYSRSHPQSKNPCTLALQHSPRRDPTQQNAARHDAQPPPHRPQTPHTQDKPPSPSSPAPPPAHPTPS
jgi:hypothetical protein